MTARPLRILYVAAGIPAPGTVGGSTHVTEVTAGLARRGHTVVTIAGRRMADDGASWPSNASIVNVPAPKGLSLATAPAVWQAAGRLRPDVLMERYYNLAGAGLMWAARARVPALLEVNAPLWDPPGSPKDRIDRLTPGHPLRRWATWQARHAQAIVTPLAEAVTTLTTHPNIVRLTWGANTDLFKPGALDAAAIAAARARLGIPSSATVAVFAGSFRRWHGVEVLLNAVRPLLAEGRALHLLLVGTGERWEWAKTLSGTPPLAGRVTLTGQVAYEAMPHYLGLADVAVAPFDLEAHAPLRRIGFYWSPLKVFEAMAMGLPVILPAIDDLTHIVRDGLEGTTFQPGIVADLSRAIEWHMDHPNERQAMGQRARERAVAHYSWAAHCAALEEVLLALRASALATSRPA